MPGVGHPASSQALVLARAGTTVRVDITNPEPVNTVSMTVGDLSTTEVLTAVFYDAAGKEIYRERLTSADGRETVITCDLPFGEQFKSFDLMLGDGDGRFLLVWIDDIKFGHYDYVGKSALEAPAANQTITDSGAYMGGNSLM